MFSETLHQVIANVSLFRVKPEAPAPPISLLTDAAKKIDDRLLSTLTLLGSEAVAVDPGLPLRMLPRVKDLPALSSSQRRLLGVRVSFRRSFTVSGQSIGTAPGADPGQVGGIEMGRVRTDWGALLPSQLALPKDLQSYRYLRGLFVQYPSHQVRPSLADACERWHSITPRQTTNLSQILGTLIG